LSTQALVIVSGRPDRRVVAVPEVEKEADSDLTGQSKKE
jgi:hypothetical protein